LKSEMGMSFDTSRESRTHLMELMFFAFDATPLEFVDAIITEEGVVYPPF